jgi:hypothetical protein
MKSLLIVILLAVLVGGCGGYYYPQSYDSSYPYWDLSTPGSPQYLEEQIHNKEMFDALNKETEQEQERWRQQRKEQEEKEYREETQRRLDELESQLSTK